MRKSSVFILAFGLLGLNAYGADLSVDSQFPVNGKDMSKAYLTVKGPTESVERDTLDAVSGASHNKGTEVWNSYRNGADNKSTLPGGLQSLFKYGVSPLTQFEADALNVVKAKDGVITIQYVHRGRAYWMATDKTGTITLPYTGKSRAIAVLDKTGTNIVAKALSPTGKVADLDWAKVWSAEGNGAVIAKVADAAGKITEVKVGAVSDDAALSANAFTGTVKLTFDGTTLRAVGTFVTK